MALKKIGSFWKSDPGRKHVLRGSSQREAVTIPPNSKLLVFTNEKGDNPKRPDYTLMIAEDDAQGADESYRAAQSIYEPPDDENTPF